MKISSFAASILSFIMSTQARNEGPGEEKGYAYPKWKLAEVVKPNFGFVCQLRRSTAHPTFPVLYFNFSLSVQ